MTEFAPGSVTVAYLDPGEWAAGFGLSLRNLFLFDGAHHGRLFHEGGEIRRHCPSGGLVAARNEVAARFLDDTVSEWLFVVDSDMGFAEDTLDRLVASAEGAPGYPRVVVGALCFAVIGGEDRPYHGFDSRIVPTLYRWVEVPGESGFSPVMSYPVNSVVRVSATGSACVLIHRTVLEDLRKHMGSDDWYTPVSHPTGGPGGAVRTFSEDLSFCVRCAQVGVGVFVDTGVGTSHAKMWMSLDEASFLRDRKAGA